MDFKQRSYFCAPVSLNQIYVTPPLNVPLIFQFIWITPQQVLIYVTYFGL